MRDFFRRRRFLSALGLGVLAAPFAARGVGASGAGAHPGGTGSLAASLESGELRDRFEIRELLERYSHTVDFMDWERLDTVFTDDATVATPRSRSRSATGRTSPAACRGYGGCTR